MMKGNGSPMGTALSGKGLCRNAYARLRQMARRVLMVNEACALPSADTAEACLKERLTHLSL